MLIDFIRLFDEKDEESIATTKPVQVKGDLYPIYEIPPNGYPAEEILRILLDPNIKTQKICYGIPRNVTKSATYVIDMGSLDHPDDIKRDFFGVWTYSGSHKLSFHTRILEDGYVEIEKCASGASGDDVYHLRRLHGFHPSNGKCKRLVALVSGKDQCVFDGRIGG